MKKQTIFSVAFLSLFNSALFAQEIQKSIFLGDTISINTLAEKDKSAFKKLADKPDGYVATKEGKYKIQNIQYNVLNPLKDGVTKVLVIGNSFSDDGVESYLHDMARSTGKPLVIGNLFRGGAPLDFHLKNAMENKKIYSYRKTTVDGIKSNTDKTSILEALKDEYWDYICFQQASATSGEWETIEASLPQLFDYVRDNYPVSTVKYLYHQTWAYGQNAITANFQKYDRDQQLMYNKIIDVSKKVKSLIPIDKLIPSGTAIQNGRATYKGDNFNREAYHLDYVLGRFTAASTWYQTLFSDLKDVTYQPSFMTKGDVELAKTSAISAIQNPFSITTSNEFKHQKVSYPAFDKIKVSFGSDVIIAGWLSLLYERENSARFDLLDNHNTPTSVNIKVLQNFQSRKANGTKVTSFDSEIPTHVSRTYFRAEVTKENTAKPFLLIENLNPKKNYKFTIISSVAEKLPNTLIKLKGKEEVKSWINPSYNLTEELIVKSLKPNANGAVEMYFELPKGEDNAIGIVNALLIEELK